MCDCTIIAKKTNYQQYDVTLKEPISVDDMAKSLEALAGKFREHYNTQLTGRGQGNLNNKTAL